MFLKQIRMITNPSFRVCTFWRRISLNKSNCVSRYTINGCTFYRVNRLRKKLVWILNHFSLDLMDFIKNILKQWNMESLDSNSLLIFILTKSKSKVSMSASFNKELIMLLCKLIRYLVTSTTRFLLPICGVVSGNMPEAYLCFKKGLWLWSMPRILFLLTQDNLWRSTPRRMWLTSSSDLLSLEYGLL